MKQFGNTNRTEIKEVYLDAIDLKEIAICNRLHTSVTYDRQCQALLLYYTTGYFKLLKANYISIIIISAEICGYTLYAGKWHTEQPFKVDILDRLNGEARIVLDSGYQLDYETRRRYDLEIAAYDCVTGLHADRSGWLVPTYSFFIYTY